MEAKVPVEIELEHQKLSKMEVDFQTLFQFLETECMLKDEFDKSVLSGRAKITELKKSFAKFDQSALEWDDDASYEEKIQPLVESHRVVLKSLQSSFRKVCVNGEQRLSALERAQLLLDPATVAGNISNASALRQRITDKSEIAKKSSEITRNILNVAQMMDGVVKSSEDSNSLLETSSHQIMETHEEFKGLTGIISTSRKLLNKYNRREMTDTLLIFFGLVLFFATVIYIISKRI